MPCTQCKESFQDSYNVTVDTLKCESPTLSAHDIRVQAAKRFRPIFHAMKEASRIENEGKEVYVNGEFEFTPDGEMYFTNAGVTSEQLHSNQLRSSELKNKPSEYSVGDHQRSRLIQYAFNNGATVVRTTFSRDGQDNRDIVEYVYDRATNRGFIRVINTAQNGLYHNFDTIREIARRQSPHLTEVAPSEKVFILTDATILSDKAQSVIQAVRYPDRQISDSPLSSVLGESHSKFSDKHTVRGDSIEESFGQKRSGSIQQVAETLTHASRRIARDTGETLIGVSRYLRRKDIQQNIKDHVIGSSVVQDVRIVFEKKSAQDSLSEGESGRLTLEKIREKAERIDESIVKRHREMRRGVVTLGLIAETGIAVHALPILLISLAEKLPVPVQAMEKSIKRHKKKEVRLKNFELRKRKLDAGSDIRKDQSSQLEHKRRKKRKKTYKEVSMSDRKHISKERKGLRKRKRKIGVGEKTGNKSAVVDRLTIFTLKKEKQLRKRRLRRVAKREKKLWRLWRAVEKSVRRHKKREIRIKNKELRGIAKREVKKERKQSIQRKEREAVVAIRFAWVVWMLLKTKNESKQTLDPRFRGDDKKRAGNDKESITPWILLSVIWYLAMAREAGIVAQATQATRVKQAIQSTKKKNNKKHTFSPYLYFPKHAVIFAFHS